MQTINHRDSISLKKIINIIHYWVWKNFKHLYGSIWKLDTFNTFHIWWFIVLLFIFSIQVHIPQNPIQKSSYPIEDINQQSIIKPNYNNSMFGSISEFWYELKGNSYSYPLPFFE